MTEHHASDMKGRWAAVGGIALLLTTLAGCGYTAQTQHRKNVRTVAVPIWERSKDIYRRDLEIRLTQAIVKRIELDTPYKVVDKPRADTLLTGTIEKIEQATTSFDPDTGVPREINVKFYVSFKWEDLRSGKILVQERNFPVSETYLPPAPFNEDFFQGSEALMDKLAERIVEALEAEW